MATSIRDIGGYDIKYTKDAANKDRKDPDQRLEIKSVGGKTIYLDFTHNCFRKHFVVDGRTEVDGVPKTQKTQSEKIVGIAEQRKTVHHGSLDGRYGYNGASKNTIVDAHSSKIQTIMTEIAQQCTDKIKTDDEKNILFKLSGFPVAQIMKYADRFTPTSGELIGFRVKRTGDIFEISHCWGPNLPLNDPKNAL